MFFGNIFDIMIVMHKESLMPQKEPRDNEKIIRRLKDENRRLKAEIFLLQERLKASGSGRSKGDKGWQYFFARTARKQELFEEKNYTRFLFGRLKSRSVFGYYQRLIYLIRKYTFVTTSLKVLSFIWAFIQSSAVFLIIAGAMAIIAPITIIFSYIAIVASLFARKKLNSKMRRLLAKKKITVLFPSPKAFSKRSYFRKMISDISKEKNAFVIIVSPYYFSPKGIGDSGRYFLALRRENDNTVMVRNHYFFTLKKKLFNTHSDRLTFIY